MRSGCLPLDAPRMEAITHEEPELSTVIVQQRRPDAQTHPFAGRARWGAAALLVTGALLQVAEFLLEKPLDDTAARVDYWAQNLSRVGLSEAVGLLAVPFLIGSFAVMIALTRARSPRLAWTAGAFLACAMTGLAAIHGAEMMAYGLLRSGDHSAAVTALEGADLGLPGIVLFVLFLGGAALGVLTMSVALWRSPLVPAHRSRIPDRLPRPRPRVARSQSRGGARRRRGAGVGSSHRLLPRGPDGRTMTTP